MAIFLKDKQARRILPFCGHTKQHSVVNDVMCETLAMHTDAIEKCQVGICSSMWKKPNELG